MERKLIKQAKNALTVTLPFDWLKNNNLNGGDYVKIDINDNFLKISSSNLEKKKDTCLVNIVNYDKSIAYHLIMGKYIEGYDKILIKHNNLCLIEDISKILIGFIIESHDENESIFTNLIVVPEENFDEIFKRILQLFNQLSKSLIKFANNMISIEELKKQEYLLDDNILYSLRYINKYNNLNKDNYKYFLRLSTIEESADLIMEIVKFGNLDIKLAKIINLGIENFVKYTILKDINNIYYSLREFRNSIDKNSFQDGLAYSLADILYNYVGFISNNK